jgi:transposase
MGMASDEEHVGEFLAICAVDLLTAWTLAGELGVVMRHFPTKKHAASWTGLVPGLNESSG